MAKVYESKAARQTVNVTKKDQVNCVNLTFTSPTKFMLGSLELNEGVLRSTGYLDIPLDATEKQKETAIARAEAVVAKIIENTPEYRTRIVGVKGIWLKDERAKLVVDGGAKKIREGLDTYSDDQLKAQLKRLQVEVPVGASHTALVDAVYGVMVGNDVAAANSENPNAENVKPGGVTQGPAARQV